MYCKHCGSQIDDTAKFCPSCGAAVDNEIANGGAAYNQEANNGQVYKTTSAAPDDAPSGGFAFISIFFPIVGLFLYLVLRDSYPKKARSCGIGAIVGVVAQTVVSIVSGIIFNNIMSGIIGEIMGELADSGYYALLSI